MKKIILILLLLLSSAAADPYRWLEDNQSLKTRRWVDEQREKSERYFSELALRESLEQELRSLVDTETRQLPCEYGNIRYYLRRKPGENKAVLVASEEGEERVLVNPNLWKSKDNLVDITVSPSGEYLAYGLSLHGSDQLEWRILDLASGEELPERLHHIQYSRVCWSADSASLFYIKNCSDVYHHRLGDLLTADQLLYRTVEEVIVYRPHIACEGRYLILEKRCKDDKKTGVLLIDLENKHTLELLAPGKNELVPIGSTREGVFFISDEQCPMGRLIQINPDYPHERIVIIAEGNAILDDAVLVGDKIACLYYVNASAELKIYDLKGNFLYTLPLPNRGSVTLRGSDTTLYYTYSDFSTPSQIFAHNCERGETISLFSPRCDHTAMTTSQIWYTSKDGTEIPMFITHRADLEITTQTPVLLFGYGGFGMLMTPHFRPHHLLWLEHGGVLAMPSLRGGKEFGTEWHEQGKLHKKQNVFDDFICAAHWLIDQKIGSSDTLGIYGSSNGGLLIGACLTQAPELFAAAVINKGVLDMLRFHLYTVGKYWMCDYGNPDNPDDFDYLLSYSPYHNVVGGIDYPPTLICTADHDDRVVPMHSFKLYARLKEAHGSQSPILLRMEESSGHEGQNSQKQEIRFGADLLTFLRVHLEKSRFGRQVASQSLD